MAPKKVPKVAYAVFVGRNPGVYRTWLEAEKEVKGFSGSYHRGYTLEDGSRARAERDLEEYGKDVRLSEENAKRHALQCMGNNAKLPPLGESIHVDVSGYTAPSPSPGRSTPQQLQTPPNTFIGKKKERPISWEVEQGSRKKATCVGNDSTPKGAMGPTSEDTMVSAAALNLTCGDNDTIFDSLSSSGDRSNNTSSDGNSHFGGIAGRAGSSGKALVNPDSEDHTGASTILFEDYGSRDDMAGKDIYPQLPMRKISESAVLDELAPHDDSFITLDPPRATPNHCNPAPDKIPLSPSSDYGDFPNGVHKLGPVPASGPRIEPRLCDEQLALVNLIMDGKNVFYTGSAGCGKSTVLKHIVPLLKQERGKVDIVTPTGRAALEVNGRTLYNYAGWVPGSFSRPLCSLETRAHGAKVWKRLTATRVLIIDEISMVSNHVFERLNHIMKSARGCEKPFGGVQIIVTGDFFQLPPVKAFDYCLRCGTNLSPAALKGELACADCSTQYKEPEKWAFCSAAWKECNFAHVQLKLLHRQKDAGFKAFLEKRRLGIPYGVDERSLLLEHASETKDAVRLFPRRANVKVVNDQEFAKLPGRSLIYFCLDDFYLNPKHDYLEDKRDRCPEPMSHALQALEEHAFEPKLALKEGMPVMLVVNWDLDSGLANGSQGTIIGFEKQNSNLLREVSRKSDYSARKNGLINAYVKRTSVQEWPMVQFFNGNKRTIYPHCLMNELGDDGPYSLLSRTQIPLIPAWAITVHKAQGMTLSRVIVDLSLSFEPGQDYVALSRAQTLEGLKVEGLPERGRGPNKQVIRFMLENKLMPAINGYESCDLKDERLKEDG